MADHGQIIYGPATAAGDPQGPDYESHGGEMHFEIASSVAAESVEATLDKGKMTIAISRETADEVRILWQDVLGNYHEFTSGSSDAGNGIFAVDDASTVTVSVREIWRPL